MAERFRIKVPADSRNRGIVGWLRVTRPATPLRFSTIFRLPRDTDWLRERAQELAHLPAHADRWCIFDNTAAGAALPNALQLETLTSP